jgi:CheY-like chemotaxis protein
MKPRILVAASPDELSAIKESLHAGYELHYAHSFFEAKHRLSVEKLHHNLQLIITVVPFNHSEPLELLQTIRAQEYFDSVPVLVLQLQDVPDESTEDLRERAHKLGATSFLFLRDAAGADFENALLKEVSECLLHPGTFERASQEHIMIADVDPYVRNLACRFITEAGYKVTLVSDGYEALDMARKDPPRLLLADLLLPRLDGLALCRLIKQDPETSHVITVIVFSVLSAAQKAKEAGADAFLKKPLEKTRFLQMLKSTLSSMRKADGDNHE